MKEIPLTRGYVAMVDDADYERVAAYKWQAMVTANKVYARRTQWNSGKPKCILMHRFILGLTDSRQEGDHKNGNGLDNQNHNLRIATHQKNQCNQLTQRRPKTSKYKGVCWIGYTLATPWLAVIKFKGKQSRLGYFATEEEAARAYDAKARVLHGEFARTNF